MSTTVTIGLNAAFATIMEIGREKREDTAKVSETIYYFCVTGKTEFYDHKGILVKMVIVDPQHVTITIGDDA